MVYHLAPVNGKGLQKSMVSSKMDQTSTTLNQIVSLKDTPGPLRTPLQKPK